MKQELNELVDRFKQNIDDYKGAGYDEENTKIDFIDRFFALLGWDVYNKEGYSEEYREVVREDKVIIKGRPKSPDYSFRFGKEKLFFVEAKRPSINIKDDTKPAYQVRRYAYSAGLTVSILTDFEEFAIYDTTVKPKENDKASIARVFYCKYDEYEKNWEFLQNTLSKKAVVTGRFKDFVVKGKGKKGTQSVDKEILKMIEVWRDVLARNIALRNKHIDVYQLNEAIQKTIDRIIFLRMAEDRNTERYGTLTDLAKNDKIYDKLVLYFNSSNKKYNSGLFKVQKWLDELAIDDKIFKEIISDLYYPKPYEFSVLPIEILGQIYEQFLGKTIRLTPGHQAKVEEKPEVRKAGGVYYTPRYIVEYIVANTVGKKLGVLGVGDGVLGVGDGSLEENSNIVINERLENENISGTERLERSDEPGGDDLSVHNSISEGGKIRADEPNTEGGGIDTVEHSGRVRQRPTEGISLPSVGGKRLPDGSGDADNNSEPAKLSDKGKYKAALGQNANSRQTSYRPAKISTTTKTPYPKPKTLKILDPACGSGSFLVGAYKYLLEYYLKYWTDKKNIKKGLKEEHIYQAGENIYRLTTKTKRKILLNNIYGVDIDTQAVEVTKLSLLLTMMEGEIAEAGSELFFKHRKEALLPDLENNIKCGNSLIGSDFYADKDMQLFDMHEQRKINCFDWEEEFPEVFGDRVQGLGDRVLGFGDRVQGSGDRVQGSGDRSSNTQNPKPKTQAKGFDCVIGNPPYGAELLDIERKYLENKFKLHNTDTAALFMGLSINLINDKGINGFIVPKPFVYASNWKYIQEKMIEGLKQVVDCGKVWKEVKLEQVVYLYSYNKKSNTYQSCKRNNEEINYLGDINKETFDEFGFILNSISNIELLIGKKIKEIGAFLNDFVINKRGAVYQKYVTNEKDDLKVFGGNEINRYKILKTPKGYIKKEYINDSKAFIKKNSILAQRIVAHIQNPIPHIKIIASLSNDIKRDESIIVDTINQLENTSDYSSKYILGILNSKLISWFSYRFIFGKAIRTMQFDNPVTRRIPYPKINITKDKSEQAQRYRMVNLVEQMLEAQKEAHSDKSRTETDKKLLQQRIDIIDKQIDRLVYELYGLTEEEIKIIEEV